MKWISLGEDVISMMLYLCPSCKVDAVNIFENVVHYVQAVEMSHMYLDEIYYGHSR